MYHYWCMRMWLSLICLNFLKCNFWCAIYKNTSVSKFFKNLIIPSNINNFYSIFPHHQDGVKALYKNSTHYNNNNVSLKCTSKEQSMKEITNTVLFAQCWVLCTHPKTYQTLFFATKFSHICLVYGIFLIKCLMVYIPWEMKKSHSFKGED